MKWIISFFLTLNFWSTAWGSSSCEGHAFTAQKRVLRCLKQHEITQALHDAFQRIAERRRKCPSCPVAFAREKNFSPLFELPFLVLKIEKSPFGGYFVHQMFRESPDHIYRVWVHPVKEKGFEVRDMKSEKIDEKMAPLIHTLENSAYQVFWI